MYNGIGLQTPRGSGTNGYIQANKFFVRPKTNTLSDAGKGFQSDQGTAGISRKPNKEILEHDRKRQIELKLLVLEEMLIDQGYTDAEISKKLDEARNSLDVKDVEVPTGSATVFSEKVSETQTHQVAALKERQMEKLKAALGIELEESGAEKEKKLYDPEGPDVEDNYEDGELKITRKYASADARKKDGKDRQNVEDDRHGKKHDVAKEERNHHLKKSKRAHDYSSYSDTDDSDFEHGKRRKTLRSKQKKGARDRYSFSESDSESEFDSPKKHKMVRKRYDSDDSDRSAGSKKPRTEKLSRKAEKRKTDSSYSSDEDPRTKPVREKESLRSKRQRHDSDDEFRNSHGDDSFGKGGKRRPDKFYEEEKHTKEGDRFDTLRKLEQLYKSKEESFDKNEDMAKSKRQSDDKNRYEGSHGKHKRQDTEKESRHESRDNRIDGKDYETRGESRRNGRDSETRGESRRDGRDNETRGESRHVGRDNETRGESRRDARDRETRGESRRDARDSETRGESRRDARDSETRGESRRDGRDSGIRGESRRDGRESKRDRSDEVQQKGCDREQANTGKDDRYGGDKKSRHRY